MNKKELVGDLFNNLRLARQRLISRAAPPAHLPGHNGSPLDASVAAFPNEESINSTLAQLLMVMERLDARIGARPSPVCLRCKACLACHRCCKAGTLPMHTEVANQIKCRVLETLVRCLSATRA